MIEKQSHLYEVLLRFDENGFKGAHVLDLVKVVDSATGEIFSERPSEARPVTVAEVGELLGRDNALLIEKAGAEQAKAEAAERKLAIAMGDLEAISVDLSAKIETLKVALSS